MKKNDNAAQCLFAAVVVFSVSTTMAANDDAVNAANAAIRDVW